MPKYLIRAKLTGDGLKGTLKEGGTSRRATIEKLFESLGGSLDAFYYAFGDDDVIVIGSMPDNTTAAAVAMTVAASGSVAPSTTVLITPEEVDEIAEVVVEYRPPGG